MHIEFLVEFMIRNVWPNGSGANRTGSKITEQSANRNATAWLRELKTQEVELDKRQYVRHRQFDEFGR